jgi:hypothetical protein
VIGEWTETPLFSWTADFSAAENAEGTEKERERKLNEPRRRGDDRQQLAVRGHCLSASEVFSVWGSPNETVFKRL